MEVVEQLEGISIEELAEGMENTSMPQPDGNYSNILRPCLTELPENSPRYVVLSYELEHDDGRISFPLVLINWAPVTSEIGMLTLHASALLNFQTTVSIIFFNVFQNFLAFIDFHAG